MKTESNPIKASIIMSTYNAEEWLEKVIFGFSVQDEQQFEIIIADDGSTDKTRILIEKLRQLITQPIIHVWHEDKGFQKTLILNKAILATSSNYLIFTDGDCIPRKDFVSTHLKFKEKGCFLSGGYFKLSMTISQLISNQDIINQNCFSKKWLVKNGLKKSIKNIKLTSNGFLAKVLNFITPTNASWNGHNSSAFKEDILAINGFNNSMQYGGEDREFGERLINLGLKSKQIRYNAICVHLDHKRGYVNQEALSKNLEIRKNTRQNKTIKTPNGLDFYS
ncbi:glycosyltransferase family 2 protein [Flavobacterium sp.]|uniref:glycosyltransferase family 2 protein n=1 Tax=Flavobacterium sp. TaxID=239 RepID=UPI0037520239